ncbi:MAG: tRNA guanosine(34) transglycosylase Tgt [Spirochaetales bacterium]|uniref:Queuine tRNA-ribosyltransferase n=1 Tax=Candidatus Thalassospirochaeta sargassi TaxID=3119039 RepID=A0AAJ1MI38_9SPIO|nr:tRNA guanosine(34) transglycosylase Tgt [Spirochaetales bacterium]
MVLKFTITARDKKSEARTAVLELPHGKLETPVFMPVGTNAAVKGVHHDSLDKTGFKLILANTYHLYLRPGMDLIDEFGGIHKFSNWKHNILTDSGGFQVFSLAPFRKIKEEGVYFRSHIDGSYHTLTPEKVVQLQKAFRSDIMMQLDVCTPPELTYKKALEALELTSRWAERSKLEWMKETPDYKGVLFGIVQGNFYKDLRKRSAEEISALDLPGTAIGGLSVGEEYSAFTDFLAYTAEFLPEEKPRYLMGIGTPEYILDAVENGIDLFDCVLPTRIARNGTVFTPDGTISLKKAKHTSSHEPIVTGCGCRACRSYSRAYMRHLFKAGEMLGPMLASEHNLWFLNNMVREIRESISEGSFTDYKKNFLSKYNSAASTGKAG